MPRTIGILSDSHGRIDVTRAAVSALRDGGACLLIHLGDVETSEVIDELALLPARLVLGNCDWDVAALSRYARSIGVEVDHPAGRITIDGRTIAYTHGHFERELERALEEGVEYLLHGHTHALRDEVFGGTRIINPGALHRARRYTAALLTPATGDLEILEIPR
jgi:putative phosphoesterase